VAALEPTPPPPQPIRPAETNVVPSVENGKTKLKSTPSLKGIFNGPAPAAPEAPATTAPANEPVSAAHLKRVWEEFAEMRKAHVAEYQILQRDYHYQMPVITIALLNPVEESLLDNFRRDLTQFLRERLRNSDLTLASALQDQTGKKVIYTARDKFEHLAGKYPYLRELKERLGLDWEF
jgi:hypothetical protein